MVYGKSHDLHGKNEWFPVKIPFFVKPLNGSKISHDFHPPDPRTRERPYGLLERLQPARHLRLAHRGPQTVARCDIGNWYPTWETFTCLCYKDVQSTMITMIHHVYWENLYYFNGHCFHNSHSQMSVNVDMTNWKDPPCY